MSAPPSRILTHVPTIETASLLGKITRDLWGALLSPVYLGASYVAGAPGVEFRRRIAALASRLLIKGKIGPIEAFNMVFRPLDSTRYFEFASLWKFAAKAGPGCDLLDVSSPRFFPLLLVIEGYAKTGALVNPDSKDLEITRRLVRAAGVEDKCGLHECLITDAPFASASFDVITCMSVLEHIPDDSAAIESMWRLLRPGGKLCLSIPCAASAFEQYRDFDEYRLLNPEVDGSVFFQRFYDDASIAGRIFSVIGDPTSMVVYGEKRPGSFRANADSKMRNPHYPFWREPYMMAREYGYFPSIGDLPGEGVVAMEFTKQ